MRGLQCHKSLYLYKHHYSWRDPIPEQRKALFKRGHQVGKMARKLFPGGIDASPSHPGRYAESVAKTTWLMEQGQKVIYEAAFQHEQVLAAVDILVRSESGWKAYEVKSASRIGHHHIRDAALQYFVLKGNDLDVEDFSLVHMNKSYRLESELDVHRLFTIKSVLEQAEDMVDKVSRKVETFKDVLAEDSIPHVDIGAHCHNPYDCDFLGQCWRDLPKSSVFDLGSISKLQQFELYDQGYIEIKDIPEKYPLTREQRWQVESVKAGRSIVNKDGINSFLEQINYPVYYIDFEAFMPAVPLFEDTSPYQHLPFQFSAHYQTEKGGELEAREFLAETGKDPRDAFADAFLEATEEPGILLAYDAEMERLLLKRLVDHLPERANELKDRMSRLVDLKEPFIQGHYHHPAMQGKFSLKSVLKAISPELDYGELAISEGWQASTTFESMHFAEDLFMVLEGREELEKYCRLDSLAMVDILKKLEELAAD